MAIINKNTLPTEQLMPGELKKATTTGGYWLEPTNPIFVNQV